MSPGTVKDSVSDFLPIISGLLGVLAGAKSHRLPMSGIVALALQVFSLIGYYLAVLHCHT